MTISTRLRQAAFAFAVASWALGAAFQSAQAAPSLPSATMPAHPKALVVESLRLPADAAATVIDLGSPPAAAVDQVKQANTRAPHMKRYQIGFGRDVPDAARADSGALEWQPVPGGFAARWSVTSGEAKALRVGLVAQRTNPSLEVRFSGSAQPSTVYGPFTEADLATAAGSVYWSPTLEGDTAIVELFVGGEAAPKDVSIRVAQVSHLVASPSQPTASLLKAVGDAGSCEVNLICRSAGDAALARVGNAVARMIFTDGSSTFFCTGTLLNSAGGQFVPYFYTANHCIDSQSVASSLTTHWFFDSTSCGGDVLNTANVQLPGGATLLYASHDMDVSFMRLNRTPPSGAVFASWDAATLSQGAPLVGVHHPQADLKKVSLGTMGGFTIPSPLLDNSVPFITSVPFIQSNWNSIATGVTEGGSSGSGIFTLEGNDYALRGGLLGGPSSCSAGASDRFDWYSRFDLAYPTLAQFLAGASATNYTALWWNPNESGWGINVDQQGDIVFATLFTYDQSGNPMWLVMSDGARQGSGDTFSGPLYLTSGTPFNQRFTGASLNQVGTMTLAFSGPSSATLSYTVNGTAVSKTITKQLFGPTGAAVCQGASGSRASATNFTDLWWSSPAGSENGWGINLTQQGSVMFATLFIYDASGRDYWLVMSSGVQQSDGSFSGTLYQTTGNGAFNTQPWPGVTIQAVGSMTLRFSDGENGTLTYTVNGTTITKPITRQVFSSQAPVCS